MPQSIVTTLGIGKDKFPLLHSSFNKLSPHFRDGFRVVLVGAVFDFARRICEVAWAWVYGTVTVTATFEAGDEAYDWINEWLKEQPRYSDSRNFDVFAKPRDIDGVKPIEPAVEEGKTPGTLAMYFPAQGTSHWMTYNSRVLRVSRKRATIEPFPPFGGPPSSRDSIKVTLFSFSQSTLQNLIENAGKEYRSKELTHIVIWIADQYGNWKRLTSRPHRDLSSVVLDPSLKAMLLSDTKEFLASERWYADRGIPYRRGYLLYGTPGSGKSSSIHALASELRLDIYIVPLSMKSIDDGVLSDLITSTPQRCIILYEDIDAAFGSRIAITSTDARGDVTEKSGITLSGLLNTIDGVQAQEGRLLFATTNHPEKLDPALSRPGRMDVKIEYSHATQWQAEQLFRLFYPIDSTAETKEKDSLELEDAVRLFADAIPPMKVSVAQLQGYLMRFKGKPVNAAKDVGVWLEEELNGSV
ncbi:P-loop containing nucleoside triphosphate hydrolase protein [Ceratobasidium sp. AG-I]|nr:P-loop containing nucleoside triphosphate hydrolase protein [Ceratobasidium sp. AG-I]